MSLTYREWRIKLQELIERQPQHIYEEIMYGGPKPAAEMDRIGTVQFPNTKRYVYTPSPVPQMIQWSNASDFNDWGEPAIDEAVKGIVQQKVDDALYMELAGPDISAITRDIARGG